MLGIVETKPIKGQYGIMTAGLVSTIHQRQRIDGSIADKPPE
jgi:hypothetical protein